MILGTYALQHIAINQARRLAEIARKACYVIRLNRGWTIYYADDPEFDKHRLAQYTIVHGC